MKRPMLPAPTAAVGNTARYTGALTRRARDSLVILRKPGFPRRLQSREAGHIPVTLPRPVTTARPMIASLK